MVGRSDIPDLTSWPLTMGTIERNEATELVPASLQLTPFCQVGILLTSLVKLLLCCYITVLYTETALIHSPERKTCHRVVQASSHLGTHILPTGSNIARPSGCTVTLLASKTRTGKQEDTLIRVHTALSIIDGVSIDDAVSVEIFGRGSESCRTREGLAIPHRCAVAHIRL